MQWLRPVCGDVSGYGDRGLALKMRKTEAVYNRKLVKGNEAIALGAIAAGCRFYAGYPITPQNEIPEFMAGRMPAVGGTFIQAESEIAAISMVMGAAATGARAMTSSSSPGISLKQEAISYMAGSEIPCVVVNVCRSGPGLGGISASQGDYFQATRGGGHGDYRTFVLAPHSVQESYDLTMLAFDIADRYRTPVLVLSDAVLGQMKEPVYLRGYKGREIRKPWALTGAKGRKARYLKSLYLNEGELTARNWKLFRKYRRMEKEIRYEMYLTEDAEAIVVAFGCAARILKTSIQMARTKGMRVGMFRPISLFPFPSQALAAISNRVNRFLVCELNTGQMVEDVRLAVKPGATVESCLCPGYIPTPNELFREIKKRYLASNP